MRGFKNNIKIQNELKANKAPDYDLITGKLLKELPHKVVRHITIIYNANVTELFPDPIESRTNYFNPKTRKRS